MALLRYLADPMSDLRAATLLRSRLIRLSDASVMRLAPRLAAALLAPEPPAVVSQFDSDDRRVLEQLRAALPVWLSWVDRMTPSELLTRILSDTAYA